MKKHHLFYYYGNYDLMYVISLLNAFFCICTCVCRVFLIRVFTVLIFIASLFSVAISAEELLPSEDFGSLVSKLPSAKLRQLPKIIDQLAKTDDDRLLPLLDSMLNGQLYFIKSSKQVVLIIEKNDEENTFRAREALSGDEIVKIGKKEIKKIRVNNRLRAILRDALAQITLFSADKKLRLLAVERLMGELNAKNIGLLERALDLEENASVANAIGLALNIAKIDSEDKEVRRSAVKALSGELHPEVRNRIAVLLQKDDEGNYIEQDTLLVSLAASSLQSIESQLAFYGFIERLFFGLSLGSVLLLAGIGLSITFGVMGVINMAHGELLMLGAYTTYVIQLFMPEHIGLSIFVSIPAAFFVCGIVGIAIERGVIQFLKGRPLETLLATFGISLILQQTVRSIFSPLNRQVSTPEWMSGTWQINPGLALTYNRLYIIIFSLIVFAALLLVMKRTSLGLYVRAVSQNRSMAKAVGIRSEWVDAMTFGLGSGIAGVAGVALSQLTNVGPNLGQSYIIDSFMVVVFGGVGNLWGTLVAAFSLGVAGKFLEPATGTVLAQILVLIFIVLFIQKRPRGLFPQKGRAAE